jgi:hypothetical protein
MSKTFQQVLGMVFIIGAIAAGSLDVGKLAGFTIRFITGGLSSGMQLERPITVRVEQPTGASKGYDK